MREADDRVEAFMKKFWLAAAAALILTAMLPDGAFAQRGGFRGGGFGGGGFRGAAMGGGFRGAAMGGGGVRMAAISPGFRSAAIGPGFRSAAIGPRFRSAAIGPAFRTAAVGPRFRTAAIGPGFRRRGFGFPFVAGVGLGLAATYPYYYSGYYSDPLRSLGWLCLGECLPLFILLLLRRAAPARKARRAFQWRSW